MGVEIHVQVEVLAMLRGVEVLDRWLQAVLAALDTSLGLAGLDRWFQAVLPALDTLLGLGGS